MLRSVKSFPTGSDAETYNVYASRIHATFGTDSTDVASTIISNVNFYTAGNSSFQTNLTYSNGLASFFSAAYVSRNVGTTYGGLGHVDNSTFLARKELTSTYISTGSYQFGDFTNQFTFSNSTKRVSTISYFGVNPWAISGDLVSAHVTDAHLTIGGPLDGGGAFNITGASFTYNGIGNFLDFYYEGNIAGSTGPMTYLGDDSLSYQNYTLIRQNNQIFKQNGAFIEYLYVTPRNTNFIDNASPVLITGGTGCITFANKHALDNFATFNYIKLSASTFYTQSQFPVGAGGGLSPFVNCTATVDLVLPMQYVDFTAGYNGFASKVKNMSFYFTDYSTATVINNKVSFTNNGSPDLSSGRESIVMPFTVQKASWKLSAGAVATENNNFMTFRTQLGLTFFPKKASATYYSSTSQPPVVSGADGFTDITDYNLDAKFMFRTEQFVPISFSQLYPQVFTYDDDISAYTMHDYADMEPRWSKYKMHVIYRNSNFNLNPAKVNLFYGLYSLYKCNGGSQTLDLSTCAGPVFTTQYANTGYDVLIKYSPLIDIKKANRMFWSYPAAYFESNQFYDGDLGSNGQVFFFNTWSVGINEGQENLVFPIKSNKWMPPENLLDLSVNDFTPLTASNATISTIPKVSALFHRKGYVYPITVSRAYSTAEAYY